jgi:predicted Zn finger-like uncharacterized protein
MRIVCPSCQAAYEVPERLLAGGKAVRCARCGAEWAPAPPTREPQPPPPARPQAAAHAAEREELPPHEPERAARVEPRLPGYRPRSVDTEDDDRPPPRDDEIEIAPRSRGAVVAWVLSLLLLALLVWAAFAFRSVVMGAWPPSTRLFAAFGLH